MDHPILLLLVKTTIFTLMLAIGINLSYQQLISLWRRPGLLLRSLLAVVVLVPLVVLLLIRWLDLPPAVATGLAVLAAAPGAPLTHKRSRMAGGSLPYSASLQLTLALLAVLITPLTLAIFYALTEIQTESVRSLEVARQVALVQLLPVSLGLLVQRFGPKLAAMTGRPLNVIANILFLALVILALIPGFRMIAHLGGLPILAIVMTVAVSLIIGHFLGGPTHDERSALAVASIARNIGLALFITTLSGVEKEIIPTLLSYMILGAIVAIPYSLWSKRRVAR
jgi:BASS family bile acid:Na+ symporter